MDEQVRPEPPLVGVSGQLGAGEGTGQREAAVVAARRAGERDRVMRPEEALESLRLAAGVRVLSPEDDEDPCAVWDFRHTRIPILVHFDVWDIRQRLCLKGLPAADCYLDADGPAAIAAQLGEDPVDLQTGGTPLLPAALEVVDPHVGAEDIARRDGAVYNLGGQVADV